MSIEINQAKKAVHDKIESDISSAQAKLEMLRAKAQAARAEAELKLIADLLTRKRAIDEKLARLQQASDAAYQQAKTDVQSHVSELETSVRAIEAKLKTA